ncbi:MAG TPA: VOC family protein [Casimicrobiaceae bacterium]|nr:VOC family protein [Casimicrobiaceae bacterium]
MNIDRIDHVVMTVRDVDATCDFYSRVLGMRVVIFAGGRKALAFGRQKINLHLAGHEYEPKAARPTPGAVDLCLVTRGTLDEAIAGLRACNVPIIEGPIAKVGATGPIRSVYFRDPDSNLIEVSTYDEA